MIRFAMLSLQKLGFQSEQNWVTLEAKMKCGIGKCGRCNLGGKFICTDGPVVLFCRGGAVSGELCLAYLPGSCSG